MGAPMTASSLVFPVIIYILTMLAAHIVEQSHLDLVIHRCHIEIVTMRILKTLLLRPDLLRQLLLHIAADLFERRQLLYALPECT